MVVALRKCSFVPILCFEFFLISEHWESHWGRSWVSGPIGDPRVWGSHWGGSKSGPLGTPPDSWPLGPPKASWALGTRASGTPLGLWAWGSHWGVPGPFL